MPPKRPFLVARKREITNDGTLCPHKPARGDAARAVAERYGVLVDAYVVCSYREI